MTPGPKKKNFNRHGGDKVADNRQEAKKKGASNLESLTESKISSPVSNADKDYNLSENKKYAKRSITPNWIKYDEPIIDPHADTMRGRDFEVLLSYSGGSESQLQLQDEKEWDDTCNGEKSIAIDLQDLANAVKCIPFHKRINLPADIFNEAQLDRFISSAENWKSSHQSKLDAIPVSSTQKAFKNPEPTNPSSDIIESYECEEITDIPTKPFVLEEKTENIIESLASCLSLKNKKPESKPEEFRKSDEAAADLDFLLSLGSAKMVVKEEEKPKEQKQTNVDDWLNSLLDD